MMKEKTTLINGGQKLFELNQFHFAAGRKLVQNSTNIITVLTTKQTSWIHEIADAQKIRYTILFSLSTIFKQDFCML